MPEDYCLPRHQVGCTHPRMQPSPIAMKNPLRVVGRYDTQHNAVPKWAQHELETYLQLGCFRRAFSSCKRTARRQLQRLAPSIPHLRNVPATASNRTASSSNGCISVYLTTHSYVVLQVLIFFFGCKIHHVGLVENSSFTPSCTADKCSMKRRKAMHFLT